MSSKLKISEKSSKELVTLSMKLNLRRNIICRLAIGKSLSEKDSVRDIKPEDNAGFEFNRYTLTGDQDVLFKALIIQHEKKKISDINYFSNYVRNHIERGLTLLSDEYSRINSPIEFLIGLVSNRGS